MDSISSAEDVPVNVQLDHHQSMEFANVSMESSKTVNVLPDVQVDLPTLMELANNVQKTVLNVQEKLPPVPLVNQDSC